MRKYIILIFTTFCLFLSVSLKSQQITQAAIIDLSVPDNANKEYIGQQEVNLLQDYHFIGTSTDEMYAHIDPSLPFSNTYSNPFSTSNFDNRAIDVSLPVGATQGSHGVSASGGATYNIPIAIPKGTAGMQPNIAISYNSQGGNGLVGYGWNIAGLSTITRAGKTIYHNGEVSPVSLSNDDRFLLDGNYLIPIAGLNGADGLQYKTKIHSFSKVTSNGIIGSNDSPHWFKVETKDGKTIEYGRTGNSRLYNNWNDQIPIFWRINKITDANENYITFTYANGGRQSRIIAIDYTANDVTGLQAYNKINFYYNIREDENKSYVAGATIKTKYILREIVVTTGGNSFKSYDFEYANEFYSQLISVTEHGSDGTELNSTIFKYGEVDDSFSPTILSNLANSNNNDLFTGDYNGDGLADIIIAESFCFNQTGVNYIYQHINYKFFKCNGNNNFSFDFDDSFYNVPSVTNSKKNIVFADFDGDGKDEMIYTNPYYDSNNDLCIESIKMLDVSSTNTTTTIFNPGTTNKIINSNPHLIVGDFDGDGAADIITILKNAGNNHKAYITYPIKGISEKINITSLSGAICTEVLKYSENIRAIDIDGDGKNELLATHNTGSKIYSFDQPIDGQDITGLGKNIGYPRNSHEIFIGDFNGDGKSDLLTEWQGSWRTAYSHGSNFTSPIPFTLGNQIGSKYIVGDFNGDGKSDIFHSSPDSQNGSVNSAINIYFSKGKEFVHKTYSYPNSFGSFSTQGDFNGDGKLSVLNRKLYDDPPLILNFNKYDKHLHLDKIKNGINLTTEFQYASLANTTHYTKGNTATLALFDFQGSLHVVKEVITSNGVGGTNTLEYHYKDAIVHREGKGFLGFKETTIKNLTANTSTVSKNEVSIGAYSLYLDNTQQFIGTTLISEKEFNTDIYFHTPYINPYTFQYSLRTDIITTTDHLLGTVTTQHLGFNAVGNISSVETNIDGGLEVTEVTYQYGSFGNYGIDNKIINQITTNTRNGQNSYTREASFDYNITNGNLEKKTTDPTTTNEVVSDYDYDDYGNIKKQTISSPNLLSKVSQYEYDSQGRNLIKTTNPLNQEKHITYHSKWSKPIEIIEIDGNSSQMEYDVFGRLEKSISPGNIISESALHWHIQSGTSTPTQVSDAYYYKFSTQTGSPNQKVWYDQLGRKRKTKIDGFNNQNIYTIQSYDNKGNVSTTTTPFFYGDIPVVSTNTYDLFNRIDNISTSLGQSTTYAYSLGGGEATATITNDVTGQTSSSTKDASGKTTSATDDGGILEMTYFSNGQQEKTKLGNTVVVSMGYDDYGRQTDLNDANAGITGYEYNAYGELTKQTDANLNVFTMDYDIMGRIETETNVAETEVVTYNYITNGNGLNALDEISSSTGDKRLFDYDNFNRLIDEHELIDGQWFSTYYGYDNFHNQTNITYPSGLEVERSYDNKGYLLNVKADGNIPIFTAMEQNALGQYKKYELGNGVVTNKTYDALGLPEIFYAQGVQNLTFNFDPITGNLLSRADGINNQIENFTYDDLNRLTSSNINGTAFVFDYKPNGNIESKTDVGDYQYGTSYPNAVRRINNPSPEVLSLAEQNIEYNAYHNTKEIEEGVYKVELRYSPDRIRNKMTLTNTDNNNNTVVESTKYYTTNYEKEVLNSGDEREVHYISGGDGLAAIYVIENGVPNYYFVYKDYLGSILTLTNNSGNVEVEQSFDAWGRHRDPSDWTDYTSIIPSEDIGGGFEWLDRGFTGHEHLPKFTLINMNGRTYDPLLGRMLSPDNYVKSGFSTQGFNRYSYAANNPLKYTDPDGEFIVVDSWIAGLFSGGWKEANKRAGNDIKIWGGLLASDPNKSFGGRVWETISRFTWQLPQTIGGFFTAHSYNTFGLQGGVESVNYKYGSTVIKTRNREWGAVTQGSYIIGDNSIEADANNPLFQHEYGHYLQSQSMGWAYYPRVGIPSIRSEGVHDFHAVEQDANRRGFLYFNKNIDNFYVTQEDANQGRGWDFYENPLNVNALNNRGQYVDYQNPTHIATLDRIRIRAKWYDHASWLLFPIGGPWWVGLINSGRYNP